MSTIRLVRDDERARGLELARRLFCCEPVGPAGHLCMRKRWHAGGHLPIPPLTPRRHVDPSNPEWLPEVAS